MYKIIERVGWKSDLREGKPTGQRLNDRSGTMPPEDLRGRLLEKLRENGST